jgi:hypothetical protein
MLPTSLPPDGAVPILDVVSSDDIAHLGRPDRHIEPMAGSMAEHEICPELAHWLRDRWPH